MELVRDLCRLVSERSQRIAFIVYIADSLIDKRRYNSGHQTARGWMWVMQDASRCCNVLLRVAVTIDRYDTLRKLSLCVYDGFAHR
jgi:hypothetical protein